MKNNLVVTFIITIILIQLPNISNAQTATPSSTLKSTITPSPKLTAGSNSSASSEAKPKTTEDRQIESLKNSIATKVAELRKKGHKAAAGSISSIKQNSIVIKDSLDNTTNIKIDETLTKIYQITGTQKKEIKQADLKKDMYIIVSGPLLDSAITANVIYVDDQYFVKSGKIVEVNADDSSIKVTTTEKDTLILDIDSKLRLSLMDSKSFEFPTTTFSKIKEGDNVHFVYTKTGKEKVANRYNALKVIVIPQEYFLQK